MPQVQGIKGMGRGAGCYWQQRRAREHSPVPLAAAVERWWLWRLAVQGAADVQLPPSRPCTHILVTCYMASFKTPLVTGLIPWLILLSPPLSLFFRCWRP